MRLGVFIDGTGLREAVTAISAESEIHFDKLRETMNGIPSGDHVPLLYYFGQEAVTRDGATPAKRKLHDYLQYNGYRTKIARGAETSEMNSRLRGEALVMMAVAMCEAAHMGNIDEAVVFGGDVALATPIRLMQRNGVHITLIHNIRSVADLTRRQADHFLDIEDHGKRYGYFGQRRSTAA